MEFINYVNVNANVISSFHHQHYHHYNGNTTEKIRNRWNDTATKWNGMGFECAVKRTCVM